ncbi:hypothetical protein IWW38_005614, partial [Coemansia aciculifera]
MSASTPGDASGSAFRRVLRKCNDFRSTPAAVLVVSTMAVFSDTVVYGLIVPFLPDILQNKLGMSSSANGILFGTFGLGVLIGAPVSAYISDRWNMRKWPMVLGLVGLGATSVLFALADAFWELVVARLAQGISSGITWAVGLAMIADVYSGEGIGQAMGVAFSGFTVGYLGGPVLGGVIYGAGGNHAIAIFVGAIAVVDLIFRLLLVEPKNMSAVQALQISTNMAATESMAGVEIAPAIASNASKDASLPKAEAGVAEESPVIDEVSGSELADSPVERRTT